jgi:hypothetical protein
MRCPVPEFLIKHQLETGEMKSVVHLREKAAQCYRLAKSINAPADVALLLALGAEADKAADELEARQATGATAVVGAKDRRCTN